MRRKIEKAQEKEKLEKARDDDEQKEEEKKLKRSPKIERREGEFRIVSTGSDQRLYERLLLVSRCRANPNLPLLSDLQYMLDIDGYKMVTGWPMRCRSARSMEVMVEGKESKPNTTRALWLMKMTTKKMSRNVHLILEKRSRPRLVEPLLSGLVGQESITGIDPVDPCLETDREETEALRFLGRTATLLEEISRALFLEPLQWDITSKRD